MKGWAGLVIGAAAFWGATGSLTAEVTEVGEFSFATHARKPDGSPVCRERWTINPDGTFEVKSGEATIQGRWRSERADSPNQLRWLTLSEQRTDAKPDCRGKVAASRPADRRVLYYFNVKGGLVFSVPRPIEGNLAAAPYAVLTRILSPPAASQ